MSARDTQGGMVVYPMPFSKRYFHPKLIAYYSDKLRKRYESKYPELSKAAIDAKVKDFIDSNKFFQTKTFGGPMGFNVEAKLDSNARELCKGRPIKEQALGFTRELDLETGKEAVLRTTVKYLGTTKKGESVEWTNNTPDSYFLPVFRKKLDAHSGALEDDETELLDSVAKYDVYLDDKKAVAKLKESVYKNSKGGTQFTFKADSGRVYSITDEKIFWEWSREDIQNNYIGTTKIVDGKKVFTLGEKSRSVAG